MRRSTSETDDGIEPAEKIDDMRDAPSLIVVPLLQERGATIQAYDPQGERRGAPFLLDITWCASLADAIKGADALVVLTEWNEFRALDLKAAKAAMKGDVLLDLRNVFDAVTARACGFTYSGIGRRVDPHAEFLAVKVTRRQANVVGPSSGRKHKLGEAR